MTIAQEENYRFSCEMLQRHWEQASTETDTQVSTYNKAIFTASAINNDIQRDVYMIVLLKPDNVAGISLFISLAHKIYEAEKWFKCKAPKLLSKILGQTLDEKKVLAELESIRKNHSFDLTKFTDIRHKAAAHYDPEYYEYFKLFSEFPHEQMINDLKDYSQYSNEWLSKVVSLRKQAFGK